MGSSSDLQPVGAACLVSEEAVGWGLDLLERLVASPSITDEDSDIADVLEPVLVSLGLETRRIPGDPVSLSEHPDFSPPETIPGGHDGLLGVSATDDRPALLLFAHSDTEPIHPGWSTNPMRMVRSGSRLGGLGVADDKAGVAALLAALYVLSQGGVEALWRPVVLLSAGKQGGALGTLPGVLAVPDVAGAVYVHPAESGRGLGQMKVASRGVARVMVSFPGAPGPMREEGTPASADPRTGHNPLVRAARVVASVPDWDDGPVFAATGCTTDGPPFGVASRAQLEIDAWFEGEVSPVLVRDMVSRRVHGLAADEWEKSHPAHVELVGLRSRPASCAASAFARQCAQIVSKRTGGLPEEYGWHVASDIRFPMKVLGVPAVGLGPVAGGFYGPNEWVDADSWRTTVEVILDILTTHPSQFR